MNLKIKTVSNLFLTVFLYPDIMNKLLFGIDVGGTKLEGVVYQPLTDKVLYRDRIPTEAERGYNHILHRIELLVKMMTSSVNAAPSCIGFGTPGKWDPQDECIKNSNTVCLIGKPMKHDLEKLLNVNIYISNDANCFALAETKLGQMAAKNPEVVFGIIMGTGVGGGIVVNGKIINGLHGIAGEWGHNFLDNSGGECYCGRSGCVETVLSGTALEKFHALKTGTRIPLKEIVKLSADNNSDALRTMNRLHHYFGKAVAQVINILDPDFIILGGGVGNIDSLYTKGIKSIHSFLFNDTLKTKIVKPTLGDSAGVFGAALLCEREIMT